jgi:hypothetical protein
MSLEESVAVIHERTTDTPPDATSAASELNRSSWACKQIVSRSCPTRPTACSSTISSPRSGRAAHGYLAALGITSYASPILQAREGSSSG